MFKLAFFNGDDNPCMLREYNQHKNINHGELKKWINQWLFFLVKDKSMLYTIYMLYEEDICQRDTRGFKSLIKGSYAFFIICIFNVSMGKRKTFYVTKYMVIRCYFSVLWYVIFFI